MKKFLNILVISLITTAVIGCSGTTTTTVDVEQPQSDREETMIEPSRVQGEGTLTIGITDAAFDTELYSHFYTTIDDVEAYTQSQGRVELDIDEIQVDLLALRDESMQQFLIAQDLQADSVSRIQFEMENTYGVGIASGEEEPFDTPDRIELPVQIDVDENQNTYVLIDVKLDESEIMMQDGEDEMQFVPVVSIASMSEAQVRIYEEDDNQFVVVDGTLQVSGEQTFKIMTDESDDDEIVVMQQLNQGFVQIMLGDSENAMQGNEDDTQLGVDTISDTDISVNVGDVDTQVGGELGVGTALRADPSDEADDANQGDTQEDTQVRAGFDATTNTNANTNIEDTTIQGENAGRVGTEIDDDVILEGSTDAQLEAVLEDVFGG